MKDEWFPCRDFGDNCDEICDESNKKCCLTCTNFGVCTDTCLGARDVLEERGKENG